MVLESERPAVSSWGRPIAEPIGGRDGRSKPQDDPVFVAVRHAAHAEVVSDAVRPGVAERPVLAGSLRVVGVAPAAGVASAEGTVKGAVTSVPAAGGREAAQLAVRIANLAGGTEAAVTDEDVVAAAAAAAWGGGGCGGGGCKEEKEEEVMVAGSGQHRRTPWRVAGGSIYLFYTAVLLRCIVLNILIFLFVDRARPDTVYLLYTL